MDILLVFLSIPAICLMVVNHDLGFVVSIWESLDLAKVSPGLVIAAALSCSHGKMVVYLLLHSVVKCTVVASSTGLQS